MAKKNKQNFSWLIRHLGRIASSECLSEDLTPAESAAITYFARANRFSRTPSAFAKFHGTTRGTVSQMLIRLVETGYLVSTKSEKDGRSVRLDLTDKAKKLITYGSAQALDQTLAALPPGAHSQLNRTLQRISSEIDSKTDGPVFGVCKSCGHLEICSAPRGAWDFYYCGDESSPLFKKELDELCAKYSPGKPLIGKRASFERDKRRAA